MRSRLHADVVEKKSIAFEALFAGLALFAAAPLWLVDHPPIQDLPQHLAAIRVLTDHGDPSLAFGEYFEIELGRTQYLAYYLAATLLAKLFGVALANRLLITAAIVGTPYAMRYLLSALDRDPRLALFVLPLTWNAHLILGFLNFIAAIPLMLLGLGLAVRLRREWSPGRAIGLAAVALLTFYTHVVPFGFLGVGVALVGIGGGAKPTLRRWLPLLPAALGALYWFGTSPAGRATLGAALPSDEPGPRPVYVPARAALAQLPGWLTDVLHGPLDERLLIGWVACVLVCVALGAHARLGRDAYARDPLLVSSLRRLALLAPLSALAYFVAPASYDWIWPINARFPLLALILLIAVLPPPRGWSAALLFTAVATLSIASFQETSRAFLTFERDEVGELEAAIEAIPEGARTAGLVYARGSRQVKFSPFLHSVAWVQAERGGAVMFTFADFEQSPIRFREENRPPRVGPRWEWMPERVDPSRDLDWYDHVLTRGGPGRIGRAGQIWEPIFEEPPWRVYHRRRAAPR